MGIPKEKWQVNSREMVIVRGESVTYYYQEIQQTQNSTDFSDV